MTTTTKTCSRCLRVLNLSHFSRNKRSPDGLDNKCRDCFRVIKETEKARREGRVAAGLTATPRRPKPPEGFKTCKTCHRTLPLDAFPTEKRTKDGRKGTCRPCTREADRLYYTRRKIRAGEEQKRWRYRKAENLIPASAVGRYVDALKASEAKIDQLKDEVAKARASTARISARNQALRKERRALQEEVAQLRAALAAKEAA